MKKLCIAVAALILVSCHLSSQPRNAFPIWLRGSWQAEIKDEGLIPLSMAVSTNALGFATKNETAEPDRVQEIVHLPSEDLLVTPSRHGWKYRFKREGAWVDVYQNSI